MKNKKFFLVLGILILIILILYFIYIYVKKNEAKEYVFYLGEFKEKLELKDDYLFTSYNEFNSVFKNSEVTKDSFTKYNYILKVIEYDKCSEKDFEFKELTNNNEVINVTFTYNRYCDGCEMAYLYYLFKVPKDFVNPIVNINYEIINNEKCYDQVPTVKKPLIYLYPDKDEYVSVTLKKSENITNSYPKYNNGWEVLAKTNGELYYKDRVYYGLYWEGISTIETDFADGFLVSKEDTIKFLEEKLAILGLNEREANEFIIYWLPILEESNYNLIRFENMDIINENMPLEISPFPDSIIRILMEYKPVKEKVVIKKQNLITPERNGFTVVEWGGMLVK